MVARVKESFVPKCYTYMESWIQVVSATVNGVVHFSLECEKNDEVFKTILRYNGLEAKGHSRLRQVENWPSP